MLQTIISAIYNREYMTFSYDGIRRVVQPATVGISSAGNDVLSCYQVAGGHVKPNHDWDLCILSKIRNLELSGEQFSGVPPLYKRGDSRMTHIYAQL